jgi:hypothetical protein
VTRKPLSPAHSLRCSSSGERGSKWAKLSTAERSSMGQVLPTEKVPFAFSRALCSLTRPVLRTDMIMTRPFLLDDDEVGGGGAWG